MQHHINHIIDIIYMHIWMPKRWIATVRSPVWLLLAAAVLFHLSITYSQYRSAIRCQTLEAFLSIHQWHVMYWSKRQSVYHYSAIPEQQFDLAFSHAVFSGRGHTGLVEYVKTQTIFNINTLKQVSNVCPAELEQHVFTFISVSLVFV